MHLMPISYNLAWAAQNINWGNIEYASAYMEEIFIVWIGDKDGGQRFVVIHIP